MADLLDLAAPAQSAARANARPSLCEEASSADALRPQGKTNSSDLAAISAAEFTRRRETARRKVAARTLGADQANALILPWAALAILAGADLPELADDLADALARIPEGGTKPFHTQASARAVIAHSICPLDRARPTLSAAFTAAAVKAEAAATAENLARYRALRDLAHHFGVPFMPPAPASSSRQAVGQQAPTSSSRQAVGQERPAA